MASKLRAVSPKTAEPSKPKILLYGDAGIGKTMFSLSFPKVYYVDCERGCTRDHYTDILQKSGGAYLGPDDGANDFQTVIEQVQALASEKHQYKTIVIDSISHLFATAVANEADRLGDKVAFGNEKKPAVAMMRRLLVWLNRVPMNVVLISHATEVWGLNEKGVREVVGKGPDCWPKIVYELDLTIQVVKVGPRRIGKIGKSRLLGFPESSSFDFTYPEFAERYGKDVIEAESTPLMLASVEQVQEIERLLNLVKLPDGQEDKWLAAASAETWSEVDADKAEKVISALKAKLS